MRSCISRNPWQARTHTWQVDASAGVDTNSGNAATPIQTIAAVNALALKPGDRVLYKRAEAWTGTQLTVPSSGAAGRPVTFADYGAGALPKITGANSAAQSIYATGKNYLAFKNLEIIGSASSNFCISLRSCHDILIDGCAVHGAAVWFGIDIEGAAATTYNLTVTNNAIYSNKATGLVIENTPTFANQPYNVIVAYNATYSNGTSVTADHGIYLNLLNGWVHHNDCYDNTGAGIKLQCAENVIVEDNYCHSSTQGLSHYGIHMDWGSAPQVSQGNIVRNNKIYLNEVGLFINLIAGMGNNYYYHNNIVNCSNAAKSNGYGISIATGTTNQVFKNNIILQDNAVVGTYKGCIKIAAADIPNNTFDYNEIFSTTDTNRVVEVGGTNKTWAQWLAYTGSPDVHSLNSNPVFVTNYTDLHLQTTSPCKNAGADLRATVPLDYDGITRDATPDIGAFEFH